MIPVRHAGAEGGPGRLRIVPMDRQTDEHEEVTWDEFHEEIEREDQVVVYHGVERDEPFEVFDRRDAVQQTAVEDEAVEEALLEGEIVTTEITDRIKAKLDMSEMNEHAYPISPDWIVSITDDHVELAMEDLSDESE